MKSKAVGSRLGVGSRRGVTILIALLVAVAAQAQEYWDPLAVDLTRSISSDLFQSNAVPYVQPMVTAINATSNARFYDHAYVPKSVDKPYFKVSVNGMHGMINDDMRTFEPSLDFGPRVNVASELANYGKITIGPDGVDYTINPNYEDTLGLVTMIMKELFRDAIDSGYFGIPPEAATLFGNKPDTRVTLPTNADMQVLLQNRPEYKLMDTATQNILDSLLGTLALPPYLTLPPGVDMSVLIAAVPQFEIGSLYGTEALIRFVPPVEFDKNVGKFSFWGFGLKHSISQYFPDDWFDMAVQAVYQGTSLTNTVGFTESKLEASATIWSGNVHVSKQMWDVVAFYTGFNYEAIDVTSTYTYVLPQEVQIALGLLPKPPEGEPAVPTEEQPGDQEPQTSVVTVADTNFKWTIGASVFWGPVRLALDYSVSQFNIFSAGLSYTF
ncbi:MAG: hypothetical protein EHM43_06630 [Ignavibacteriae bacterium]|nr:MAG: hypothetical protein EHM43_06630 [Ignavibacteriota bacterium]